LGPLTRGRFYWLMLALYLAVVCNSIPNPLGLGLRFTRPDLNYLTFSLAQLIPFVLLATSASLPDPDRAFGMSLAAVLLLIAVPFGSITLACAVMVGGVSSRDLSFDRIRTIATSRGPVAVYRSNVSALDDFGIDVRQECTLIPGLMVIEHPLASRYQPSDATVTETSPSVVTITFNNFSQVDSPSVEGGLRRWPCIF
jgi:hypothetical protein